MALDFDGIDDIAQNLNGVAALDTTSWTIAAWINADTAGEGSNGTILTAQNTDTTRCNLRFESTRVGALTAFDNGATDAQAITTAQTFADVSWRLVIGVFDVYTNHSAIYAGTTSVAVAAEALFSDTALVTKVTGSNRITIGNQNLTDRTFDGRVTRVGLWTRALGLDDMELLRAGTVPVNGCRSFYPCGDDGFASNRDAIGGFHLTITGALDVAGPTLPLSYTLTPSLPSALPVIYMRKNS
jgi:hypothetical protein